MDKNSGIKITISIHGKLAEESLSSKQYCIVDHWTKEEALSIQKALEDTLVEALGELGYFAEEPTDPERDR